MATVNMNTPLREGADAVRVGVILTPSLEGKDCVVISEEGHGVYYKSGKDEEAKNFCFDQVVTADNIESFHPELLQPLTESIPGGYNGALLICGASTDNISTLIDHSLIKQVLANVFSRILSKEELFISVSFLQFYPDGTAVDLLSPSRQTLKLMTHPVLVNLVGGLCEVCVSSAEEAYSLYETCRETLKSRAGSIYNRCTSMFSVTVEWKPHPEEVECEVFRCSLQLFSLAGGASRTDLRGVTPLVKALDQIQCEDTTSDKLLDFLLNNAFRGNSRTVLIYCIHPQGLLDDETPSALALAQKASLFVTEPTRDHWCPRATEQEIRCSIMGLRTRMMSEDGNEFHNTSRLAELTQNLQMVKNQSWEKRREKSKTIKDKTQSHPSRNSNWHSGDQREVTDRTRHLRDLLKQEMEEHIRDGKGNVMDVQKRVARIQQLREALGAETQTSGAATEESDLYQQSQWEYNEAQERRRHLREDCERLIQEEVEKTEKDLAQELTEGPQRELLVLTRERQVLVLQMEALRTEAQQAERDLRNQYHRHQTELQRLREESLLVFRVFHQVSEEQRKTSEGRYRSVLLEAVQDAVYLSAQNQQLQADNKQLRKALGKLKDTLAVQGDTKDELCSPYE